jgi:hypothetical protein
VVTDATRDLPDSVREVAALNRAIRELVAGVPHVGDVRARFRELRARRSALLNVVPMPA